MILHRVVGGWGEVGEAVADVVPLLAKCPGCGELFPARSPKRRVDYCTESCRRQDEWEMESA